MEFEYDENKSRINKAKHGISFEESQNLWLNEDAIVVPENTIDGETRYALISILKEKCYVAIFIFRNVKYRIISVRRCRRNEEKNYEKSNN